MKILVAYATNSSGTLMASQIIVSTLSDKGHEVTHKDIRNVKIETLDQYDLILFGSPSWNYNKMEGQPHEYFSRFMEQADGKSVSGKKFAVFGLGDTAYIQFCGAVDHIQEFVKKIGGELIAEPLRVDGYFFDQKNNEEKIKTWADSLGQTSS